MKIFHRDGGTTTISEEDQRRIAEHTQGKTLAEVAAGPPAFAHLLEKRDPPPTASWLDQFFEELAKLPRMSPEMLSRYAETLGLPADTTREQIIEKMRNPPTKGTR